MTGWCKKNLTGDVQEKQNFFGCSPHTKWLENALTEFVSFHVFIFFSA